MPRCTTILTASAERESPFAMFQAFIGAFLIAERRSRGEYLKCWPKQEPWQKLGQQAAVEPDQEELKLSIEEITRLLEEEEVRSTGDAKAVSHFLCHGSRAFVQFEAVLAVCPLRAGFPSWLGKRLAIRIHHPPSITCPKACFECRSSVV